VPRARPFIEAGLPVFVDKPLALTVADLRTFIAWERAGARILSCSGLRYAPELAPYLAGTINPTLGELRWISGVSTKTWERYGIHLLEPIARVLGPGFVSVRLESSPVGAALGRDETGPGDHRGVNPLLQPDPGPAALEVAHLTHRSGVQVSLPVIADGGATFGTMHLCGVAGQTTIRFADTYSAFRGQLVSFLDSVRTGVAPYPFSETVELMSVLIAGMRSRAEGSRRVAVAEILSELS
jgi:predicted dehydrogenase